ncbi:hypothetical protein [Singulisphaera acidiphila]|uniref:Uncharacterized protein n=1 Tax=Singulisphaera acidiphila (strain ATCC BAA-1392 / DSM 18658 / VKM B-2454 / MOB10) TaxID=886293 RepID=L0DII8_SINAD|nr:hypothetical protein [Singulisphaera acidiphila]AGA28456.1 hypothetical protein Sinac_4255 [Singulisphaera acidiphila DSM 18658]
MIARFAVVILASQWIACLCASAQSHLEPENGILNATDSTWNSSKRIREVLLKEATYYHLARMVCLPSFDEPEWVVTVVRQDGEELDAPHTYFVEYVGAETKLFLAKGAQDVQVKRSRAPLDRSTAESLNKTWRRMLRSTRYPKDPRLGADGVNYHFSRFVPLIDRGRNDPLAGWEQGKIWTPDEDSLCGELVAIGEELKRYAVALPADRDRIHDRIRAKEHQLKAKLNRESKTAP